MEIINRRRALPHTAAAIKKGRLKIGFIGGSITSFGNYRSYCEYITSALMQDYPSVRISTVNAGIGGTGLGGLLGAQFAIKGGSKRIRQMMFVVLGILFVKMLFDYVL